MYGDDDVGARGGDERTQPVLQPVVINLMDGTETARRIRQVEGMPVEAWAVLRYRPIERNCGPQGTSCTSGKRVDDADIPGWRRTTVRQLDSMLALDLPTECSGNSSSCAVVPRPRLGDQK